MRNPHRQVKLRSGATEMVANLPDSPKLRRGNSVTLRDYDDPDRWWDIVWVSDQVADKSQLNRTWHNNI